MNMAYYLGSQEETQVRIRLTILLRRSFRVQEEQLGVYSRLRTVAVAEGVGKDNAIHASL